MDFYYAPDWFGRPGPYAFTLEHFLFIAIATFLGVLAALLMRRCTRNAVEFTLVCLWAFLVVIEIWKWVVVFTRVPNDPDYPFNIETMLPLHSCSMFLYVFPFAIFSRNQSVKRAANSFLVSVNMIMGFITMFVGFSGKHASVFSFFGLHTLLFHAIIFIVPLIMLVTGYYKPEKKDILYGGALFLGLATIILIFDLITGCDYMYIHDGHTFGVFKFIYENVPWFVWTIISVSAYLITGAATHFLILGIRTLLERKNHPKETDR